MGTQVACLVRTKVRAAHRSRCPYVSATRTHSDGCVDGSVEDFTGGPRGLLTKVHSPFLKLRTCMRSPMRWPTAHDGCSCYLTTCMRPDRSAWWLQLLLHHAGLSSLAVRLLLSSDS